MLTRVRENGLGLFFGVIFVLSLVAHSLAGWQQFNDRQVAEQMPTLSWRHYVASADFAVDVAENWQSEYLQFLLFIAMTVWLVQKGSPESKQLDRVGRESLADQRIGPHADPDSPAWAKAGGWRTGLLSNSLVLVMGAVFLASWLVQSLAGWAAFNQERLQMLQDPVSWSAYLVNADFWSRTLQNWQSEFLAVGSMVALSIYLRQRGSPESKPVGAPHSSTGVEG